MPLRTDLKSSVRGLVRAPATLAALVISVAIGVGANSVVFGYAHGTFDRELPLPDRASLVSIFAKDHAGSLGPLSLEAIRPLRSSRAPFASVGIALETQRVVTHDKMSTIASVCAVDAELARMLTLRRDPDGADLRLIAPSWLPGLYAGRDIAVWTAFGDRDLDELERLEPTAPVLWAIARLQAGVTPSAAERAINAERPSDASLVVVPYTGVPPELLAGITRTRTLLILAIVAVFIVACGNITIFLLARISSRARETALRVALGANRRQLGVQLMFESAVVAVLGAGLGVLLAFWTRRIVPAMFFEQDASQLQFAIDLRTIVLAAMACAAILFVCGLLPLWTIRRDQPGAILRRDPEGLSPAARRVRQALVAGPMACACLLVLCAGLLIDGFTANLRTTAGQHVGVTLVATIKAQNGFDRPDLALEQFRRIERAATRLSGVTSVAWTDALPGQPPAWQSLRVERADEGWKDASLVVKAFTEKAEREVSLKPLTGRMFGGADAPGGCRAVMINDEADRALFDGRAVGKAMTDPTGIAVQIVGTLQERARPPRSPSVYYYADQGPTPFGEIGAMTFRVPAEAGSDTPSFLTTTVVSAGYFEMVGMSTVAGMPFRDDVSADACRVGVVNEEAGNVYFGGHAVGGSVIDDLGRRTSIVGVVRTPALRASQRRVPPSLFLPLTQNVRATLTMVASAVTASERFRLALEQTLEKAAGDGGSIAVSTLDERLARGGLASERLQVTLMSVAAAAATALALIGMFGMLLESVRQRHWEVAMRVALGAKTLQVTRLVLIEAVRLAAIACAIGGIAAVPVVLWLKSTAPGAIAFDVRRVPFATAGLVLAVILTSVLPVRLALRANPLKLLKRDS